MKKTRDISIVNKSEELNQTMRVYATTLFPPESGIPNRVADAILAGGSGMGVNIRELKSPINITITWEE